MSGTGVILCGGTAYYQRRVMRCWALCNGARRRVVVAYDWSPYYGPTATCCHCGDKWAEGQLLERPFLRGWRAKSTAAAKRHWTQATAGPPARDDEGYLILGAA